MAESAGWPYALLVFRVQMSSVSPMTSTLRHSPSSLTVLAVVPVVKPVPVMVTVPPPRAGPLAGEIDDTVGAAAIAYLALAATRLVVVFVPGYTHTSQLALVAEPCSATVLGTVKAIFWL